MDRFVILVGYAILSFLGVVNVGKPTVYDSIFCLYCKLKLFHRLLAFLKMLYCYMFNSRDITLSAKYDV